MLSLNVDEHEKKADDSGSPTSYEQGNLSNEIHVESPIRGKVPPAHKFAVDHPIGVSLRHNHPVEFVEPKVFSPHRSRQGQVPRRIEVERKKRSFFQIDITRALEKNGVMADLLSTYNITSKESIDSIPLSIYYNSDFDSRSVESWAELVNQAPLKARAKFLKHSLTSVTIEWRSCLVIRYKKGLFRVVFTENKENQNKNQHNKKIQSIHKNEKHMTDPVEPVTVEEKADLDRLFICFDAEDPSIYCEHLLDALERKKITSASLALNLYVDCMPTDGLREMDSEQANRILVNAINTEKLRRNAMLDTSAILQQFNMNHKRTLNQMILLIGNYGSI